MKKKIENGMVEFLAFLNKKILEGVKQKDIATYINKPNSYVNRLYLKNPKSCPLQIQNKIAEYFEISRDKMLEVGAKILKEDVNSELFSEKEGHVSLVERRSVNTKNLLRQVDYFKLAIMKNDENCEFYKKELNDVKKELDKKNKTLKFFQSSFHEIHEGITFFDITNNLAFSTNRWNLLPTLSESKNRSIDAMIISLKDKVSNFGELLDLAGRYQKKKKKETIFISFKGKGRFRFTIIPVFEDKKFIGTAIINSPSDKAIFSDEDNE
jgi:hypothetical protein